MEVRFKMDDLQGTQVSDRGVPYGSAQVKGDINEFHFVKWFSTKNPEYELLQSEKFSSADMKGIDVFARKGEDIRFFQVKSSLDGALSFEDRLVSTDLTPVKVRVETVYPTEDGWAWRRSP